MPQIALKVASAGVMMLTVGAAFSQNYPTQTIRIVTGSVGGGSDFVARQVAQGISGPLGQSVVVENRASLLATETVAKAQPDGYSLLVGGAAVWQTPLVSKVSYDPLNDLAPVSLLSRDVFVLAVHPSLPVKSVKELVALAKAHPGDLNYSSGLTGATTHLAGLLFASMANIKIVVIPYKGTGPAVTALLTGEVQFTINEAGLIATHEKAGKMRALAVTSATRSALTPNLPTASESGVPGYEWIGMTHMMAPGKTPPAVVSRVNQEVVRYLNTPDVKERFIKAGSEVVANSPQEFTAIIKADMAKISKVIKESNVKLD